MPRSKAEQKARLLSTRVTERIADLVQAAADSEGLTTSEWIRNLVIKELKDRKLLGEGVGIRIPKK